MLWFPLLCSFTTESSPCLPSAYTYSRCWCLSGMFSMKLKWFVESRLHDSASFVLTSSKISHLFLVLSPHVSLTVMLHHIYRLAWFTDQVNFPLTVRPGSTFKYFKYSNFPPSSCSGREWCQLGMRSRVHKLLQGRQGRCSFEQGCKEVVRRWDLGTHYSEVCVLKWRSEGTMIVGSKPKNWCTYTRISVWARSQVPKPVSQQPLRPVLYFPLWSGSGRDEPNAFQVKHTFKNILWKSTVDKHMFCLCHAPGTTLFLWCGCWRAWNKG